MAVVEPPTRVSKLPLLIMGAVVGVAVLVTIALVALRGPKTYDPGSPEAGLQDFLEASFDSDTDAMVDLLTDETRARCDNQLDERRFDNYSYNDGLRAELDEMSVEGATASAIVTFRQTDSNDPFDSSSWSYSERFELIQVEGVWLVDRAGWPYELAECTRGRS